jgi:hypothetical protein
LPVLGIEHQIPGRPHLTQSLQWLGYPSPLYCFCTIPKLILIILNSWEAKNAYQDEKSDTHWNKNSELQENCIFGSRIDPYTTDTQSLLDVQRGQFFGEAKSTLTRRLIVI